MREAVRVNAETLSSSQEQMVEKKDDHLRECVLEEVLLKNLLRWRRTLLLWRGSAAHYPADVNSLDG